jgi:hypothetical protein
MMIGTLTPVFLASFFVVMSSSAQETFQNLNFEQAMPVIVPMAGNPYYPYAVTAASALPDWTVSYGGVQQTQITENAPSAGSTWVVLIGPGSTGTAPGSDYPLAAIDGNYSVLLQGGLTASSASISQMALIPAMTQSLLFEADPGSGPLTISIGGENVPFAAVGTGPNYTLYSAHISAWAGNDEALTFSALESDGLNNWLIDDISFSPVPEASPILLTGIGGLAIAIYRRFRK